MHLTRSVIISPYQFKKIQGGYISAKFSLNYCLIMVLIYEIILTQNLSIVTLKC